MILLYQTKKQWGFEGHDNKIISKLSDGERRRLSIIETDILDLPICFFDEPESNLDRSLRDKWLEYVAKISERKTVVIISHFDELYEKMAKQIINFKDNSVTTSFLNHDNKVGVI